MAYRMVIGAALCVAAAGPVAAQNVVDGLSANAPALAPQEPRSVGVTTLTLTNPDQPDITAAVAGQTSLGAVPSRDRDLVLDVWYPAVDGATGDTTLNAFLRDGVTQVELQGRAVRDAQAADTGPLPLVLLSHGYPGNRYLMSHLGENLASKGYVVASIDHDESTYRTANGFATFPSTLLNRPRDQMFVLDQLARKNGEAGFALEGRIDAENTGIVGYSMGGYGALIAAGAGLADRTGLFGLDPYLTANQSGTQSHADLQDDRLKTVVAIGPWGRQRDAWDRDGLSEIDIPALFIAGSADDVSLYEDGVRQIFADTVGTDRALLTFEGEGHNAAAPIPAPDEAVAIGGNVLAHYEGRAFSNLFMNDVAQHFLTAWFDAELKGDDAKRAFLELVEDGADGWTGFADGAADGLRWETLAAGATLQPIPLPAGVWLLGGALLGLGALRRR
ncbi:VPLPA-CTERM sorting domain-containing protein [Jannaschia sp. LMIT008]|uniref:alpha/beta hydrolase family protein n=1 Tax=Jannaschia maritima TaxID=3032585 RepID=UPI0028126591|nr:VPLPA-CTERM sorting domain-containing protein [Jannaschia sp. LMIT008]